MRPVLFHIGPVSILSYGVVLTLSLVVSLFIMWRLYKNNLAFFRFRVTLDSFFDSALVFLISFGIGARFLHIVQHFDFFGTNFLWWLLFLHFPGFSFFGGVIGAIVGLWLFARSQKQPFLLLLDLMMVGLVFTLSFSRIGSLLHGDSYGKETAFLLKVSISGLSGMRHPTQLYEAMMTFAVFALLYYLYAKGKSKNGQVTLLFLLLVGLSRFFLEMLRGDSVYLGSFAVTQLISALFVCASLILLAITNRETLRLLKSKFQRGKLQ